MPYWTVFYKKIKGEEGLNGKFFYCACDKELI